jgi:AMMECR1 domain-containing protein
MRTRIRACSAEEAFAWLCEATSGHALPRIARVSVLSALHRGEGRPLYLEAGYLATAHPVFVTIRDSQGPLRGCMGTLKARCRTVAEETWQLAREAAFSDERFTPVTAQEMAGLRFEVSVVQPLEDAVDVARLDPQVYGVVVSTSDGRRGALLPGIEGVTNVIQQMAIARRKAGIGPAEPVRLQRFMVERFAE